MKALSIREPWASLIINKYKIYEFRSWKTKYRGKILIHASQGLEKNSILRFKDYNLDCGKGEIIGIADITDCILIDEKFNQKLQKLDKNVYNTGYAAVYAWKLENVRKFNNRIPCKGNLGLWNYKIELRDLYDENKELTNHIIREDDQIPLNYYLLTVIIIIKNSKGEFLIQKRSEIKGGKWAFTGGHPTVSETSLEGIINEVKEEIGIDISNNQIILYKTMKTENIFFDLYYVGIDINIENCILQEKEVNLVKWASIDEINSMMENNQFHERHFKALEEFLNSKVG